MVHPNCLSHTCHSFGQHFRKIDVALKNELNESSANPQLSKKDKVELLAEGPLNNTEAATQLMETATQSNGDETALDVSIDGSSEDPDIGQYWKISNRKDLIYAQVVEKDHFMVQFFEPYSISEAYCLNDLKFEVLHEDFVQKVQEPQLIAAGRSPVNYFF